MEDIVIFLDLTFFKFIIQLYFPVVTFVENPQLKIISLRNYKHETLISNAYLMTKLEIPLTVSLSGFRYYNNIPVSETKWNGLKAMSGLLSVQQNLSSQSFVSL